MNSILRNILAVIAGVIFGSIVNMSIIMSSGNIIPPPAGVDVTNMESLKTNMHLFQPKHFLLPFLAHALGTFAGALITALIAASHQMKFAIGLGVWFLIGGIANVFMLPSPLWFTVTDLVLAYLPMAFLGGWLAERATRTSKID